MTIKSTDLTILEQAIYVESYKQKMKRMNFAGGHYLNIFTNAVKRHKTLEKEEITIGQLEPLIFCLLLLEGFSRLFSPRFLIEAQIKEWMQ